MDGNRGRAARRGQRVTRRLDGDSAQGFGQRCLLRAARRTGCRLSLVCAVAVAFLLAVGTTPALAAIAKVQSGTFTSQTAVTSITPTLSSASTAGDLLTAIVATSANTTITAPAGWTEATGVFTSGAGTTEIRQLIIAKELLGRIKADTEARRPLATFIALAALPYSLAGAVFPGRPIESCRA